MVRKKATEPTTATKAVVKKAAEKKVVKKDEVLVDAENAGFRAGDVYNALHDNEGAKSVKELVKLTGKTEVEVSWASAGFLRKASSRVRTARWFSLN